MATSVADTGVQVEWDEFDEVLSVSNHSPDVYENGPVHFRDDQIDRLLHLIGNELGEQIEREKPVEVIVEMVRWLRVLEATETDDEHKARLGALADGVLEKIFRPGLHTDQFEWAGALPEATSVGPVSLDIEMARSHGWTDRQIRRARCVLHTVSRMEYREASHRQGFIRRCEACECWTVLESFGPCHLCQPYDIGVVCGWCQGTGESAQHEYGWYDEPAPCRRCNNTGRILGGDGG